MNTIYMVEDEALLRELFEEYVKLIPNLQYLGSCADGRIAVDCVLEKKPDILILDIRLPEINGLELLTLLRRKLPDMHILIFTGSLDPSTVKMALDFDADGFVEKAYGLEELKNAIMKVCKGEKYFSQGADQIRKTLQS